MAEEKPTIKLYVETSVPVDTLHVRAGVRYWEDAEVDGVDDEEGRLIPDRSGDSWCPTIDIRTGQILCWPTGTTAKIHYKVCDEGDYWLSCDGKRVAELSRRSVPDILCPGDLPDGDCIVMKVDSSGRIANWDVTQLDNNEWEATSG